MHGQTKVTGVILAGGLARRMGGRDKGLIEFRRRPLLAYAIDAMSGVVDELLISANRNLEQYRKFGFPVLSDANANFEGPLAGILSALRYTHGRGVLLVMPCDSPLFTATHVKTLLQTLQDSGAECCSVFDGERVHPVFLAMQTHLTASLEAFLAGGQRKIGFWLNQQSCIYADFSSTPEIFANANTPEELAELAKKGEA